MNDVRVRLADGQELGPVSLELLLQWVREGRIPAGSHVIASDGQVTLAAYHPALAAGFSAPPMMQPASAQPAEEFLGALIPYRNGSALTGYYLGVFSVIPVLGLLLGPAALVLGIRGFKVYKREPHRQGAAHAVIAIVAGSFTSLGNWGLVVLILIEIIRSANR